MSAFNFQSRFVPAVEFGSLIREAQADGDTLEAAIASLRSDFAEYQKIEPKFQTIRAERKDGRVPAKVGDTLQLYTGMRTKACRKLGEVRCQIVQPIYLSQMAGVISYTVDGDELSVRAANSLAQRDGFGRDFDALLAWFDRTHGLPFTGWLIRW